MYVSLKSLWIRPYVYPLIANAHYRDVQQRLYVSATIGDAGDLSRRLGTRPIEKIPVLPEYAQQTYGRRLIVMNRIEDEDIPKRLQAVILAAARIHPEERVVVCQSGRGDEGPAGGFEMAERQRDRRSPKLDFTSLGGEVDEFKRAAQGHLIVGGDSTAWTLAPMSAGWWS